MHDNPIRLPRDIMSYAVRENLAQRGRRNNRRSVKMRFINSPA